MKLLGSFFLCGRVLIVLSLLLLSFEAPAMPVGMSAECAAMMQSSDVGTVPNESSKRQLCPYAALCAVAGLYLNTTPPTGYSMVAMSNVDMVPFGDTLGVGVVFSPPTRPPRS